MDTLNIGKVTGVSGICRVYISLDGLRVERWEISRMGTGLDREM